MMSKEFMPLVLLGIACVPVMLFAFAYWMQNRRRAKSLRARLDQLDQHIGSFEERLLTIETHALDYLNSLTVDGNIPFYIFSIEANDGEYYYAETLANGTSVNSVLVRQRRLAHGDIINIGNHRLLYHNPAARTAGPLPAPGSEQLGDTAVMRSLQAAATGARQAR